LGDKVVVSLFKVVVSLFAREERPIAMSRGVSYRHIASSDMLLHQLLHQVIDIASSSYRHIASSPYTSRLCRKYR